MILQKLRIFKLQAIFMVFIFLIIAPTTLTPCSLVFV